MRRVKKWRSSERFQRRLATYCLASEKRFRRMRGHAGLPVLLRSLTEREDKQIDPIEQVA